MDFESNESCSHSIFRPLLAFHFKTTCRYIFMGVKWYKSWYNYWSWIFKFPSPKFRIIGSVKGFSVLIRGSNSCKTAKLKLACLISGQTSRRCSAQCAMQCFVTKTSSDTNLPWANYPGPVTLFNWPVIVIWCDYNDMMILASLDTPLINRSFGYCLYNNNNATIQCNKL